MINYDALKFLVSMCEQTLTFTYYISTNYFL